MKITKKPLIGMALTSSVALAALSTGAHATNPFALQTLDTGYEVAGHHAEGKCGEAKCGGDMKEKAKEGKCGEAKCGGKK